jgi:hypothetical protein
VFLDDGLCIELEHLHGATNHIAGADGLLEFEECYWALDPRHWSDLS